MRYSPHTFHIPVMGTGFTIDTPLRVARFGISSVMSLVDDALIERIRQHHCQRTGRRYEPIRAAAPDARAQRITAYLDLVGELLIEQLEVLRALPFAPGNDKTRYFELLPEDAPLRRAYLDFLALPAGAERESVAAALTAAIVPGSADVNIMTKVDRARLGPDGQPLGPDHADAKAALRGFAGSRFDADLVLSAGLNPTLFGLLERFPAFYRDASGHIGKGLILKVSDFRSASVQARLLAKKGLEVKELRIESGLNCGGHAFATDGHLLGPILDEIRAARDLHETLAPTIRLAYERRGLSFVGEPRPMRITVQGGIGTHGETRRLRERYGADATGWASPFLLVPEATALDPATRQRLAAAGPDDLYVSDASPLGVPFNNLRGSSSERWMHQRIEDGEPGSSCPRGYLATNTTLGSEPICTASTRYMRARLTALGVDEPPRFDEAPADVREVYAKACICHHLGNGALIDLGLGKADLPVAVCPGPNLAHFDREYSLREMVDHVYGRGASLVPADRPHLFAAELVMYVDQLERRLLALPAGDTAGVAGLASFRANLEQGLAHYRELVRDPAYPGENLASLAVAVERESARLAAMWPRALARVA